MWPCVCDSRFVSCIFKCLWNCCVTVCEMAGCRFVFVFVCVGVFGCVTMCVTMSL